MKLFCSKLDTAGNRGTIYRYPNLFVSQSTSTIFAYAQKIILHAPNSRSDHGVQLQSVVRKSNDDGQSWSNEVIVRDQSGIIFQGLRPVFFEASKERSPALMAPKLTHLPPLPTPGSESTIEDWLRKLDTHTESTNSPIQAVVSDDLGQNWKHYPVNILPSASDLNTADNHKSWSWSTCGGRSIRLKRKPDQGRLLVPVFWKLISSATESDFSPLFYSGSIYSNQPHDGSEWRIGSPVGPGNAECRFVELADRLILMHALSRSSAKKEINYRRLAASPSQGMDWIGPHNDKDLPDNLNAGSWIRFSRIAEGARMNRTIMSQVVKEPNFKGLVLRMSYEEGMTWSFAYPIQEGAVDRSEIVGFNKNCVGVLYEHGTPNFPWQSISLKRIQLKEITQGADTNW